MTLWRMLVVLRVALALVPQTGYIHPDEFFQSIEVVAGDILDLRVQVPWEFNATTTTRPIRNILIPYVIVGMPIYFIKCLSELSEVFLDVSLLTPYLLVVLPRLTMTFASLYTDSCLHRLCKVRQYKRDRVYTCLSVYASSQVVLVFLTRTLSNSIESFLLAGLLTLVGEDIVTIKQNRKCHWLGFITAVGFFNRPTFLAYAFVPLVIWILNSRRSFQRCFSLMPAFLATSSLMIFVDTLYYGHLNHIASTVLLRWDRLLTIRWIVTPLNFIAYNLSGSNLIQHGLHPCYVHILINNVILFGILGIIGVIAYFGMLYKGFIKRQLANVHIIDKMCACSFVFPIIILSFFPHQEPRFIQPVLFPLVFLHADQLTRNSVLSRSWKVSWILLNLLGTIFFGFLHQAGVVPSLAHIQRSMLVTDNPLASIDHVIYYHTYMPPTSLLLRSREAGWRTVTSRNDCAVQSDVRVYDLMGAPPDELHRTMDKIRGSVLVVSPTSVRSDVVEALKPFETVLNTRFWMHISMEDPPPLTSDVYLLLNNIGLDMHLVDVWKNVTRVNYLSAV